MTEYMEAEMERGIREYRSELLGARAVEHQRKRRLETEKEALLREVGEQEAILRRTKQENDDLDAEVIGLRVQSYSFGVIKRVAEEFGITPSDICHGAKDNVRVWARNVVAYTLRSRGFSMPQIGRMLGGMHHTSIMHALNQAEAMCENPNLKEILERVQWPVL